MKSVDDSGPIPVGDVRPGRPEGERGEDARRPRNVVLTLAVFALVGILQADSAQAGTTGCDGSGGGVAPVERSLESGGSKRTYRLQVPSVHDGFTPLPIVLNFHGYGGGAAALEESAGFTPLAERDGFILVHPQGLGQVPGWNSGGVFSKLVPFDDVKFIRSLIDTLGIDLCADPTRVFAVGISNGGGMVDRLGCELSARIVAIAPISGAYTRRPKRCNRKRPVSVLEFHGDADKTTPYRGDEYGLFLSVPPWLAEWARRSGCKSKRKKRDLGDNLVKITYRGCPRGVSVRHYRVRGGGHSWFGSLSSDQSLRHLGYKAQNSIATPRIWRFFRTSPIDRKTSFAVKVTRRGSYTFRAYLRTHTGNSRPLARFKRLFKRAGTHVVSWHAPGKIFRGKLREYRLSYRGARDSGTVLLRIGR